ncbi:MAG: hypothetical protein KKG60_02030 [Nanoarchaeota archaeon]|nr:hypothetical protein [Nanoarchaeota archaeon]
MVDATEFRTRVTKILSQDYQIEFLGGNFDKIVNFITETKAGKIYAWISEVINENIQPIIISSKKSYKKWKMNQLLVFRYPLNINNIEYRVLLVKVKNSIYIEFHLGSHKYYDKVRKDFDLTRKNC